MIKTLFPRVIDNDLKSYRVSLYLLALIVLVKLAMGVNSLFNTRFVAEQVDGIPISTFTNGSAEVVLAFFAIWGLGQVVINLFAVLIMIRYRALVPLMYLLLLLEHFGRKYLFHIYPIFEDSGPVLEPGRVSPFTINSILMSIMVIGFIFSLLTKNKPNVPANM